MITDLVDRISPLPDFILGHILSFLPTDKAVATSILSKRWKFAWVTVHSLDFDNSTQLYSCEKEEDIMEFIRFVNRVLLLNDAGWLNKFNLTCRPRYNSPFSTQIISWINIAVTRNVHDLYLSVGDIDMPTSLFSCDSLRSLDLYGSTSIDDTTTVSLPRLESLKIDRVSFKSEEACENLINGCPILHSLKLNIVDYRGDADDDITCIISSPSLRRLEIYFENRSKLKLKASSLEYLRLGGYISEIFVEKSLISMVEAYFDVQLDERDFLNNSIVEAVRAFDCAKFLTLSVDVMRGWPHTSDLHDHSRWKTPLEVPRCLSTSLKEVYFHGNKDERDMICYMLKYGSVVEVMSISCYKKGDGEKLKLLKEISEFPRKSPVCRVQFF